METKHTPGPWNLDKRQEKLMGANGQSIVVWNSGLSFGNRTEEAEANARLIAAAPELLAALKKAYAFAVQQSRAPQDPADALTLEIIEAIVRAEGR